MGGRRGGRKGGKVEERGKDRNRSGPEQVREEIDAPETIHSCIFYDNENVAQTTVY